MFHAYFRGVFHLVGRSSQVLRKRGRGHGAGHAHLALAADFSATDGGVEFVEDADGGGGHQNMAATQLKNTTKELAYQQLLSEIDNTLDDEENS